MLQKIGANLTQAVMHIPGYKHVYDVRTDRIGGGCSLYIHDAIPLKQRKDLELGGESVFIEVNGKIFNTNKNVLLAVIYRSPDSPLGLFNEQLEHTLLQIDKEKKVALLSGDFNCNTYRELSINPVVTQDFINTFSSFNYHKLITQPTRIVRETGHIKSATHFNNYFVNIGKSLSDKIQSDIDPLTYVVSNEHNQNYYNVIEKHSILL